MVEEAPAKANNQWAVTKAVNKATAEYNREIKTLTRTKRLKIQQLLEVQTVVNADVQNTLSLLAGYPSQTQVVEAREHPSSVLRASANTVEHPGHGASTSRLVEDDVLS